MKCTRFSLFVSGAILLTSTCSLGDDNVFKDVKVRIEGLVAFTEGPAWHPDGNVYFSDGANNRILRRDRKGQIHVYRQPSGRANGLLFDLKGRLVCCEGTGEGGNRRVTRTEMDGTITVLTIDSKESVITRQTIWQLTARAGFTLPIRDTVRAMTWRF